jgi:hypothetical protein
MSRFENALLDELREVAAEGAEPRRRVPVARRRTLAGLAAAGAAVAAITGALVLGPGTESPAYSLEKRPDGRYYLEIHRVSGIAAANERLAAEGIRARVYEEQPPGGCPEYTMGDRSIVMLDDLASQYMYGWLLRRDIPAGLSVLMTLNESPGGPAEGHPWWSSTSATVVRGDPPPCIQAPHESGPDHAPSAPTPSP